MEAPDRIYLAFDNEFVAQASTVKEDANKNSIFLPEYTPIEYIRKDWLLEILQPSPNLYKERYEPMWIEGRNFLRAQLIDKIESL